MLGFTQEQKNAAQRSPLSLAFIGDAVYDMLVRRQLLTLGEMPIGKLHNLAVEQVRASAQAQAYHHMLPQLTEAEIAILKRGRNSSTARIPKNADLITYRKATGVEALFGYLYLSGQNSRIEELFAIIQAAPESASPGGNQDE